jgi:hypothetical protein
MASARAEECSSPLAMRTNVVQPGLFDDKNGEVSGTWLRERPASANLGCFSAEWSTVAATADEDPPGRHPRPRPGTRMMPGGYGIDV